MNNKSDRRQRVENRLVAQWAKELDQQIERDERWLSQGGTPERVQLAEHRLAESRSIREVIARGLDSKTPRKFRGRVLLEARCSSRGHVLARVYPSSTFPVFIPSVSAPPAGKKSRKENRFSDQSERDVKAWNAIFRGTELERLGNRDEWILDWSHSEKHRTDVNIDIRGLTVLRPWLHETLLPWLRESEVTAEGQTRELSFQLLCRCGETWLPYAVVMEAVDSGQRVLAV